MKATTGILLITGLTVVLFSLAQRTTLCELRINLWGAEIAAILAYETK